MTHDFSRHAHQSYMLVLITKGSREIDLPQQTVRISAGQGFCLPSGFPHACRSFEPHDYFAISTPEAIWHELQADSATPPLAFTFFDRGGNGLAALQELLTSLRFNSDSMAIESALQAVQSVVQPGMLQPQDEAQKSMVQQVRDWLLAHYTKPVRLGDLAKLTGWRPGTVNRIFRMHMGMPPYEFLMHQRLREVARLLRENHMTLVEIAAETGFADQSHMQRLFHRTYGVTPKTYRSGGLIIEGVKPVAG